MGEWSRLQHALHWARISTEAWTEVSVRFGNAHLDNFALSGAVPPDAVKGVLQGTGLSLLVQTTFKLLYPATRLKFGG